LYLTLASAYVKAGQPEKARLIFENLLEQDPKNLPALLGRGRCLEYSRPEEARRAYEQILAAFPKTKEAFAGLARIYARHSEELARAADPEFLAHRKEFIRKTDSCYRQVITDSLRNADILYEYGAFLFSLNYPDSLKKSIAVFQKVLALEPFFAKAYGRLGMAHYQAGDYPEARKQYEMAISLNPLDYNTYYNLGELFLTVLENMPQAWEYFQHAVQLSPENEPSLYKLGVIAINNRNYKEALGYLDKAYGLEKNILENSPPLSVDKVLFVRIQLLRATAWENLGNSARSKEILSETYQQDPFDPVVKQKLRLYQSNAS
jgi:pentatricopeptide repeat protein